MTWSPNIVKHISELPLRGVDLLIQMLVLAWALTTTHAKGVLFFPLTQQRGIKDSLQRCGQTERN